jgi:hypothetical protein
MYIVFKSEINIFILICFLSRRPVQIRYVAPLWNIKMIHFFGCCYIQQTPAVKLEQY